MMEELYLKEEKLSHAFNVFDLVLLPMTNKEQNKNGQIDLNELKVAFGLDESEIDEEELKQILEEADLNNDGNIDFDDFFKLMDLKNEYQATVTGK